MPADRADPEKTVQVHPMGLVKPDDADAMLKFLAAAALRGVCGIVLDNDDQLFRKDLGRRDYVTRFDFERLRHQQL